MHWLPWLGSRGHTQKAVVCTLCYFMLWPRLARGIVFRELTQTPWVSNPSYWAFETNPTYIV